MKSSIFISRIYLAGLFISVLVFSPFILDFSLVPRFISLSLSLAIVVFFIVRSRLINTVKPDLITVSYLLYNLFCFISVIWAINKQEAIFAASKTTLFLSVFLISYLVFNKEKEDVWQGLKNLSLLVFFILLLVIIYQFLSLKKIDHESLYLVTAINGHKNLVSSFLFLNLFFLLSACSSSAGKWKLLFAFAAIGTVVLLFFLKTKAVWLASIITCFVFLACFYFPLKPNAKGRGYFKKLMLSLLITNVFFIFLVQPFIQKSISYAGGSVHPSISLEQERLVLWDKTYVLFHQKPLIGVGAGNWQVNFPDATLTNLFRAEDLNYTFQRPHNDFLWILSETGLLGFNLFLVFLFSIIIYLSSALRTESREDKKEVALIIAFITGYLVISFFDFPKERIEHGIFITIILALGYSVIKKNNLVPTWGEIKIRPLMLVVSGYILLFLSAVGLLRYQGEYYTRKMYDAKNAGDHLRAISAGASSLSFAYSLDPTSVPISWYIANATTLVSKPGERSHAYFIEAFALAPYNQHVVNDLASSFALKGEMETAKKYYTEAARISPRFDDPKLNLVAIYINERNYKKAAEWIQTIFHNSERRTQYQRIIDALQ